MDFLGGAVGHLVLALPEFLHFPGSPAVTISVGDFTVKLDHSQPTIGYGISILDSRALLASGANREYCGVVVDPHLLRSPASAVAPCLYTCDAETTDRHVRHHRHRFNHLCAPFG